MQNTQIFHLRNTWKWVEGNKNPNYAFQLAVAYFDWADDGIPLETPEEAFERYTQGE